MNILYIEDDVSIAEIYSLFLHSKFPEIKIDHFTSGADAYLELSNHPEKYSLVISDFALPGKNGGELFKFVNGQMLGIPFVILSGHDCSRDDNFKNFFQSHVKNAFLLKPCPPEEFIAKITWCLESEKDKLKIYLKPSTNLDEKTPLSSEIFLKLNSIPCDVHVKLSSDKFVKIINKNELFSTGLIIKLINKGVKYFYINKSELSLYGESVAQNLYGMLKTSGTRSDDASKSQLTGKALDVIRNNLSKCGFSQSVLDLTEEVILLQVDMIQRSPELSEFMAKFQLFRKMNTEHSRLVSFFCVCILKEIGWDSESTLNKMCLASLFHDISLPDGFVKNIAINDYLNTLSDADRKAYENHCEQSAHLAKNFCSIAPGIEQVILEHHELPDGTGFPKKLTATHVHALSACLHLADVAADLMWKHDFDMEIIKTKILEKKEFYSKGFYRKPYEALAKTLKK